MVLDIRNIYNTNCDIKHVMKVQLCTCVSTVLLENNIFHKGKAA